MLHSSEQNYHAIRSTPCLVNSQDLGDVTIAGCNESILVPFIEMLRVVVTTEDDLVIDSQIFDGNFNRITDRKSSPGLKLNV